MVLASDFISQTVPKLHTEALGLELELRGSISILLLILRCPEDSEHQLTA